MSGKKVQVLGPVDQPIGALLEFHYGARVHDRLFPTMEDGCVEVPVLEGIYPDKVRVIPCDGHWRVTKSLEYSKREQKIYCPEIKANGESSWWRNLTCGGVAFGKDKRTRIGVIDIGVPRSPDANPLHVVGLDENLPSENSPVNFHGLHVATVVSSVLDGVSDYEIFLWDAADASGEYLDTKTACSGISALVQDYGVDVINISSGFHFDDTKLEHVEAKERFEEEIEFALLNGCAVVVAAGNENVRQLAMPAELPTVVGVGSIGLVDAAPVGTDYNISQVESLEDVGNIGRTSDGQSVFFHHGTCFGPGLDAVAPGIGVDIAYSDGSIFEMDGTSFAAPIVTAILSQVLCKKDFEKQDNSLQQRVDYVKETLKDLCDDTGIHHDKQGFGIIKLPQIKENVPI